LFFIIEFLIEAIRLLIRTHANAWTHGIHASCKPNWKINNKMLEILKLLKWAKAR